MATSTSDQAFLCEAERIFTARGEMLVEVCYPYAAGSRDFWIVPTFDALQELLHTLRPRVMVNVYRQYSLPLRGIIDEALIQSALQLLPDGGIFLIVYPQPQKYSSTFQNPVGHIELEEDLRSDIGQQVAIGPEPDWGDNYSNILYAVVPEADGSVKVGIY